MHGAIGAGRLGVAEYAALEAPAGIFAPSPQSGAAFGPSSPRQYIRSMATMISNARAPLERRSRCGILGEASHVARRRLAFV
jgi:hypothetical protein